MSSLMSHQRTSKTKPVTDPDIIDSQILTLTSSIQQARETTIPTKSIDTSKKPLPARILNLIEEKRKIYRDWVKTKEQILKTTWNRLNAFTRLQINQFHENSCTETCSNLDYRDGKSFWKKFKSLTGQNKINHSPILHDNQFVTDNVEKANIFASHLATIHQIPEDPLFDNCTLNRVSQSVSHPSLPLPLENPLPESETLTEDIHPEDLKANIMALSNAKASGPDQINPILLKNLPESAINFFCNICNNCLSASYFPSAWKVSNTIVIPKPGKDPKNPNSYRPIALLNILGKIFEKLIATRLSALSASCAILPPTQFGFRHKHSSMDALLKLHTDTTKAANLGECTLAVFLDIERAFDKVWHDGLVYKLTSFGFPHKFTKLISSFLSNRSFRIKIFKSLSNSTPIAAGVPQGSPLSPILYLLYCSDIPIPDSPTASVVLFADDTACWSSKKNVKDAHKEVQNALQNIEKWARRWRIKPNPGKTQTILFINRYLSSSRRFSHPPPLTLWNQNLEFSDQITYLGIAFHKSCSLLPDVQITLKKIRNRANLLGRLRGRFGRGCNPETLNHTYKTFIRPVVEYRAVLYSTLKIPILSKFASFERKLTRKNFRLHYRHPSNLLHLHNPTPPIADRLKILQKKYVKRTLDGANLTAIATLRNPWHRSRKVLTRKPKFRMPHPPTALLSNAYEDLPEDFQDLVDDTPYTLR